MNSAGNNANDKQMKVIRHLESALGEALSTMTGKDFTVAVQDRAADVPQPEEPIIWQQSFSVLEGPSFWVVAGRDLWEALGRLTLESAGIDEVTDDDCRSTWQEIIGQTAAGIAAGLTADQSREVTASKGDELDAEPPGLTWFALSVTDGGKRIWSFKAACFRELAGSDEARPEEHRVATGKDSSVSKTFELLLEVALPVNVSFGRTSMQIREVLKLNTGSIVELNRFVSDPVEVIVNDCVIARGEVVVVDGNYGVRINQLASREDRLRTGMTETTHKFGARP